MNCGSNFYNSVTTQQFSDDFEGTDDRNWRLKMLVPGRVTWPPHVTGARHVTSPRDPGSQQRLVPVWDVEEVGGDELLQGDVARAQGVAGVFGQRHRDQQDEQDKQVDKDRTEYRP